MVIPMTLKRDSREISSGSMTMESPRVQTHPAEVMATLHTNSESDHYQERGLYPGCTDFYIIT